MVKFDGIKYAPIQEIFFAYKGDLLYKFPVYKGAIQIWSLSDYKGYNGNERNWLKATKKQIEKYDLIKSFDNIDYEVYDGQTGCYNTNIVQ